VFVLGAILAFLLTSAALGRRQWLSFTNLAVSGIFLACLAGLLFAVPSMVDQMTNTVLTDQTQYLPEISEEARELHKKLWIADLHSDSLLWPSRDLGRRNDIGHVDIPRLLEGNVALQALTIVTSSPMGMNFDRNPAPKTWSDTITLKVLVEQWGLDSVQSLAARTLFQVERFNQLVEESQGQLVPIRFREDLEHYMNIRSHSNLTAAFLGIEGLHALDGQLDNINRFYDAGVRMMAASHFFDNDVGGSAHGLQKYGLTSLGKQVIQRAEKLQIMIDIAHASEAVIDDILALATRPIISSHTGVRGVCDSQRNLRDHHIRGVAATGGVLGVAYFRPTQCGDDILASVVKTILYIRDLVGVEHVALGSDYDGTVAVPFDTTGVIYITESLLRAGLSAEEIRLIMGGNVQRVLLNVLPQKK